MTDLVDTALALSDGKLSLDQAVEIYLQQEQAHGVYIYDDHDARVAPGAFKPHMSISAQRVRALTKSWEQFDRALEPLGKIEERQLVVQKLGPFVRDTGLWMAGEDLADNHLFIFENGEVGSWTAEQWEDHLTNWASIMQYEHRDNWTREELHKHMRNSPRYREWAPQIARIIEAARDE